MIVEEGPRYYITVVVYFTQFHFNVVISIKLIQQKDIFNSILTSVKSPKTFWKFQMPNSKDSREFLSYVVLFFHLRYFYKKNYVIIYNLYCHSLYQNAKRRVKIKYRKHWYYIIICR